MSAETGAGVRARFMTGRSDPGFARARPTQSWFTLEPPGLLRPWAVDAVVTTAALAAGFASVLYVAELAGWPVALLLNVVPPAAVAARRCAPVVVLAVTVVLSMLQWMLAVPYGGAQISVLVALYTVARYRSRANARWALAATLVLALISPLRQPYSDVANTIFTAVLVILIYVLGTNVELRAAYLRELVERADRLERERDAASAVAVAQERARIARELHDAVAHHVSVMVVQAEGAGWALGSDRDRARAAVTTIADTGRATLAELRRLLGVLRAPDDGERAPQPGLREMPALAAGFTASGLAVGLQISDGALAVPDGVQLAAFRIVQESLTNALKHSGAGTRVSVAVTLAAGVLRIEVCDDGSGAEVAAEPPVGRAAGHGLIGIRERVSLFDGRADIGPRAGGGFRVWVELACS